VWGSSKTVIQFLRALKRSCNHLPLKPTNYKCQVTIREAQINTPLSCRIGNVDIINVLIDIEMSVNLTSTVYFFQLHLSAKCVNMEATKAFVERRATLNYINKCCDTQLLVPARNDKV
jgi:hypothetical protein